jgi:hypothetical protein
MPVPDAITTAERAALVRKLYRIADMFNAIDVDALPMNMRFQLSGIKSAAEHTARSLQDGWDISSEERNAA